jgi:hypothetical protein
MWMDIKDVPVVVDDDDDESCIPSADVPEW